MRLTRTIAFRLFVLLSSVQVLILVALTYASVRIQQSDLMENVVMSALRLSDLITRSTRHSMLVNQKEEVHNIISSIGGEQGIEGLRIYNKQGEVIFGTIAGDLRSKVDMNAEACVSCHGSGRLESHESTQLRLYRIFTNASGDRVLGLITPIKNEAQCSDAACHAHPANKTILGVLDVKMSLVQIDRQLVESRNQLLLLSAAAVLMIGLVSWAFIWLFVRRPVKRLMVGMEMVSTGHLDHRLEATTSDELGQLARTFNDMTQDLDRARKEITAWSSTLEKKVKEKTADLEKAHKQMVKVEKMASLGNLASSVAHELNNPLEGILTFARLLIKRVQKSALPADEIQGYREDLTLVADEALRCGNIVKNLLVFSRQKGMAFQQAQARTIIDRCVLLVNHHAKMRNIQVRSSCADDDGFECDPGQIQQVLIALMMNAIEAMSGSSDRQEGGTLTVSAAPSDDRTNLVLRVSDTGAGMSEEIKAHIFEPFFTTKSEGKGVGLGLAITYGIIERHHGSIEVESTVGRGTEFTITLPITQPVGGETRPAISSGEGMRT